MNSKGSQPKLYFQDYLTPQEAEVLKEDVKIYDRMKRTYTEMIKINEEKICRIEEEYIENALTKHGHVFDAWKEMKLGRFGQSVSNAQTG